jgi:hypothetical protein
MAKPKPGAKPSRSRKPKEAEKPARQRRPIPRPHGGETGKHPLVWRFSMIDLDGPWGWAGLDTDFAKRLCERCINWESMHEGELFGQGGNKRIPAENMCEEAQRRLAAINLDDYGALWELKVSGKPRVWGLRSGHVFYPVWWDPEHSVCPSKKKHT